MIPKKTVSVDSAEELICTSRFGKFFGVPQPVFDKVWQNLSSPEQGAAAYISMEIGADPDLFHPVLDFLKEQADTKSENPELLRLLKRYLHGPRKIPNYSGGLGVLAGDTLKSFADLHVPVFAVSLLYREGYFSQLVDSRIGQIDQAMQWRPEATPTLFQLQDQPGQPLELIVPFFNEYDHPIEAKAHVWMKMEISEELDYFVPEFLLDYSIPSSPPWVREAGLRLYNAKSAVMKANQRRMLGAGILPLTERLGLHLKTIHLNEQHGVTVTLHIILRLLAERLGQDWQNRMSDRDILEAAQEAAKRIVYTIHTPVKAGHDRFARSLYTGISHGTNCRILDLLANDPDSPYEYNFTAFAMRVNRAVNSVSRLHRDVTRKQFPEFAGKIKAVTNGVHHLTWISGARAKVFDETAELDGWRDDPGIFGEADFGADPMFRQQFRAAWEEDNQQLISYVNQMLSDHRARMEETWIDPPNYLSHLPAGEGSRLSPGVFTIGFARRFSTYKRADLIFDNLGTLADILVQGGWRINFLFAGKAHPQDEPGKSVLKLILDNQEELYRRSKGLARLIFIPGYDMKLARLMVAGVHTWLNSPKRPLEASGTSGMKAAMNGVPNLSVMDGWWVEGYHEGQTGWKFGYEGPIKEDSLSEAPETLLYAEDSQSFYKLLPKVLEMFHSRPDEYLQFAVNNLRLNVPIFNTHRMAAEYVRKYDMQLDPETDARVLGFAKLYKSDSCDWTEPQEQH